jgi:hypothetical protein
MRFIDLKDDLYSHLLICEGIFLKTAILCIYLFIHSFIFPLLLCWVWVHCSIYQGSYNVSNISYMNSPPPLLPFIMISGSFNRYHLCIYIHVYTFFAPYSSSYPLSLPPPPSHWYHRLPTGPVLCSCFLILWNKKYRR